LSGKGIPHCKAGQATLRRWEMDEVKRFVGIDVAKVALDVF
jgi:hypothetical protein